jgi:hypothetical protein
LAIRARHIAGMPLHISKVAFGNSSVESLAAALAGRGVDGEATITTRYRPKRAEEMVGGSLFWIIKHHLVARSPILGFADGEAGRTIIRLSDRLIPIRAIPRRAHQGWRYIEDDAAPRDLGGAESDEIAALPTRLAMELSALALI